MDATPGSSALPLNSPGSASGSASKTPQPLRVFHIATDRFCELRTAPEDLPTKGFVWLGIERAELEHSLPDIQAMLQRWQAGSVVDLHVSDLLNPHLPSHYDYTSWYDLLVFRRLTAGAGTAAWAADSQRASATSARQALAAIDTSPVGFVVFDRVLLTVHPSACSVLDFFAQRMAGLTANGGDGREGQEHRGGARLPSHPAELMLRKVNHMVDSYLDLRRLLTRQQTQLQQQLLDPKNRFNDWQVLMDARNALHVLEDTCEDQRGAVQEWIDALDEWPSEAEADKRRERELLRVRSRDVLEHVERVLSHVRRLEQSAETAVQMHFSALGHRTNAIMRTLTVLTAIFLPLNLITGFFGMNFDSLPLIHSSTGIWITIGLMVGVAVVLIALFMRKRYLGQEPG